MKFNLINPSDPYTFESDDLEIAALTACILGDGKYPADAIGADANQDNRVPPFIFTSPDDWFTARFGGTYEARLRHGIQHRNDALARSLESVTLGADRRTSLNDIRRSALNYAKQVRQLGEQQAASPAG